MSTFLTVVKVVFSVIGWTLLVLLFFPVRLEFLWQDSKVRLDLRYLFLRRRLVPGSETEKGKAKGNNTESAEEVQKKSTEASSSEPAPSETEKDGKSVPRKEGSGKKEKDSERSLAETVDRIMRFVRPLLKPGFWLARMLLRAVHLRDVSVVISVTGSDPASIGFRSGIQWALVGNFMRLLNSLFGKNVTYGDITVFPCFGDADPIKEKMSCTVSVQPIIIILLVLGFGIGYAIEAVRTLLDRGGKKNVN